MPCYLGKRLSLPTFLPHLVLPGRVLNPKNEIDLKLGKYLGCE
jgi:hypothetical protein